MKKKKKKVIHPAFQAIRMIIDFHLFLHSRLESERGLGRREPKKHEKLLPLAEYQHCPSVKYFPNDLSNSCNILMR